MSFWRIVHNLVRHNDTPTEVDRATEACVWLAENFLRLRKVCKPSEIELLTHVHTFWFNHKSAPSFQIVKETIERKSSAPGVIELLSEYEEQEGLTIISVKDMGQLLVDLIEEWQSNRLANVLKATRAINNGTWEDPKTKQKRSGPKEAAKYLLEQVEAGMVFSSAASVSGALNDTALEIRDLYDKLKADHKAGNLRIKTGINEVDTGISIKRGDFVGVLGYAGQRKTTLCRTIVYNAARMGFNVLHVSLEQTYDEERIAYALIHSKDPKFGHYGINLSKKAFDDGNLTDEQERFLKDVVLPDLEHLPGRLLIRQPTEGTSWNSIKTIAEVINQTTPLDLFFVDYLALVSTTSTRDAKAEMELNIKDAKQTALQFDDGRSVVFLTPIQGNRKGYEEAITTGGQWDMTGVYEYSEFDKSADTILTVFVDKTLQSENAIVIGSVKTRRSAPLELVKAPLDVEVGLIGNLGTSTVTSDRILKGVEDDIE